MNMLWDKFMIYKTFDQTKYWPKIILFMYTIDISCYFLIYSLTKNKYLN